MANWGYWLAGLGWPAGGLAGHIHFISETRAGFRCHANAQALGEGPHSSERLPERGRTARGAHNG